MFRFKTGDGAAETTTNDPQEILAQMNEEKQKRLERAQKFGIETKEIEKDKKQERMSRFGGGGTAHESVDEAKAKINERKARFGQQTAGGKFNRESLDFSLDEYKSKKKQFGGKKFKGQGFKDKKGHGKHPKK